MPVIFRYTGSDPSVGAFGDIIAHTQTNDSNAGAGDFSVRFVSPVAGLANISGRLWDAHQNVDRNQAWEVLVNGISQDSGVVLGNGTEGSGNPDTFSLLSILLQAGDTVVLKAVFTASGVQTNGGLVGLRT